MPLLVYDQKITAALNGHSYRKFGENPNAGTGGQRLIWPLDGAPDSYVWPTTAATIALSSDAPADTGLVILMQGLGDDGNEYQELVAVGSSSIGSFFRVYRMSVTGAVSNAGLIEAKHGTDTLAVINVGDNQTQQLFSTVPGNKALIVSTIILTLGANRGAEFQLWVKDPVTPFSKQGTFYIENESTVIALDPYVQVDPLNDWYLSAELNQAGSVAGQLFGYLLDPE